jgi:hypothetical protein
VPPATGSARVRGSRRGRVSRAAVGRLPPISDPSPPAPCRRRLSLAAFHSAKFFSYGIKGDEDDGTGTLLAKYFHTGGGPRDGSDRIMYQAGTGKLLYDADGQKAAFPTVHIATLPEDLALRARDFELVA